MNTMSTGFTTLDMRTYLSYLSAKKQVLFAEGEEGDMPQRRAAPSADDDEAGTAKHKKHDDTDEDDAENNEREEM